MLLNSTIESLEIVLRYKHLWISLCLGASPLAMASDSNIACYFSKPDGSATWQWGLNADLSRYSIKGHWKITPYTKVEKFFASSSSPADLRSACENARRNHEITGSLMGIFAAVSGIGNNYPIVIDGAEVSPTL